MAARPAKFPPVVWDRLVIAGLDPALTWQSILLERLISLDGCAGQPSPLWRLARA